MDLAARALLFARKMKPGGLARVLSPVSVNQGSRACFLVATVVRGFMSAMKRVWIGF